MCHFNVNYEIGIYYFELSGTKKMIQYVQLAAQTRQNQ